MAPTKWNRIWISSTSLFPQARAALQRRRLSPGRRAESDSVRANDADRWIGEGILLLNRRLGACRRAMRPMRVESDSFDPETTATPGAAARVRERRAHQVRETRKRVIAAERDAKCAAVHKQGAQKVLFVPAAVFRDHPLVAGGNYLTTGTVALSINSDCSSGMIFCIRRSRPETLLW